MSTGRNPIDYERVDREVPSPFPWVMIFKLLLAALAVPMTLCLFWLIVLVCYWFKYGRWPGWGAPLGG